MNRSIKAGSNGFGKHIRSIFRPLLAMAEWASLILLTGDFVEGVSENDSLSCNNLKE
jgi:hypothetical protein